MPIIKSAKKKMRKDKKRTKRNMKYRADYDKSIRLLKKMARKKGGNLEKLKSIAYSKVSKAAKRRIIHKNKKARLESQIAKIK